MRHHPSIDDQIEFFKWVRLLSEGLPGDHPIRVVHSSMRGSFVSLDRRVRSAGYYQGLWQIFIPSVALYIEMRYIGASPAEGWREYRAILEPCGYRFKTTENYAEALLWLMDELRIENTLARRDLTVLKAQITGTKMLLKRQNARIMRKRKDLSDRRREAALVREAKEG